MAEILPVRFSHLKAMALSAAHCRAAMDGDMGEATAAKSRGSAVHAMLFDTAPVRPWTASKQRRGKEWDARDPDTVWLLESEYSTSARMVDAIAKHPEAMKLLAGVAEETILFDMHGRACRSTPDVRGKGYVTELKTCRSSEPQRFAGQSQRLCYHGQLAMQGLAAGGVSDHYVVAVESVRPYPVTCFRATERAIDLGQRFVRLQLERLIACEESGQWPPYSQSILELDVLEDEIDLVFGDEDETAHGAGLEQ